MAYALKPLPIPLRSSGALYGQPLSSVLQLANRQKGAQYLSDLDVACAVPPDTSGFTLQIFDLTRIWSDNDSDVIELDDILALAAAVYMFIKLYLSTQQRYPRTLPR